MTSRFQGPPQIEEIGIILIPISQHSNTRISSFEPIFEKTIIFLMGYNSALNWHYHCKMISHAKQKRLFAN